MRRSGNQPATATLSAPCTGRFARSPPRCWPIRFVALVRVARASFVRGGARRQTSADSSNGLSSHADAGAASLQRPMQKGKAARAGLALALALTLASRWLASGNKEGGNLTKARANWSHLSSHNDRRATEACYVRLHSSGAAAKSAGQLNPRRRRRRCLCACASGRIKASELIPCVLGPSGKRSSNSRHAHLNWAAAYQLGGQPAGATKRHGS